MPLPNPPPGGGGRPRARGPGRPRPEGSLAWAERGVGAVGSHVRGCGVCVQGGYGAFMWRWGALGVHGVARGYGGLWDVCVRVGLWGVRGQSLKGAVRPCGRCPTSVFWVSSCGMEHTRVRCLHGLPGRGFVVGEQEPVCAGAGGDRVWAGMGWCRQPGEGVQGLAGVNKGEVHEGASTGLSWGERLCAVLKRDCAGRATARQGCSMPVGAGWTVCGVPGTLLAGCALIPGELLQP